MYRLRQVNATANSSMGEWLYFESAEAMRGALMTAAISAVVHKYDSRNQDDWRATKLWHEKVMFEGTDKETRWIDRVVGVDKLVDGEWVELKYVFHPPRLELEDE